MINWNVKKGKIINIIYQFKLGGTKFMQISSSRNINNTNMYRAETQYCTWIQEILHSFIIKGKHMWYKYL
jgi:hypothetical protein